MKKAKYITIATVVTLGTFFTVLYTSCKKDDPDPCSGISCLNSGKCNAGKCICPTGFEGTFCETTTDPCKNIVCQNGGVCVSGTCNCSRGYEGVNCETKSRDKFVGTYLGTEACSVGTDNYTIALTAHTDAVKLTMSNLYNDGYSATCDMVAIDSFTFAGASGVLTYSGTGRLVSNTITIRYTITNGTVSNSCVFTGNK